MIEPLALAVRTLLPLPRTRRSRSADWVALLPRTIRPIFVSAPVLTCKAASTVAPVLRPTRPAEVIRRRSKPLVLAVIVPAAPVAESASVPALVSSGVVTEVVAASAVVLTPLLAVTRPVSWLVPLTVRLPPIVALPEVVRVVVWVPPFARSRPAMVTALPKVAALVTASVLLRVVAPTTLSVLPKLAAPVAPKVPVTSSVRAGLVMPMPTRPALVMRRRSEPLVLAVRVPVAPVAFSANVPALVTDGVATPPLAVSRLVTVTVLSKVAAPRARRVPSTSSRAVGASVLMPTKPALAPEPRMRIRSRLAVRIARS